MFLARNLDLARALGPVPPEPRPSERADDRLDHDQVHELPVNELLERHRPEHARLLPVQPKGVQSEYELEEVEAAPVGEHHPRVEEEDAVEREEIDQRR